MNANNNQKLVLPGENIAGTLPSLKAPEMI